MAQGNPQPCEVCGQPTPSKYGVCERSPACKREWKRRDYAAMPAEWHGAERERLRAWRAANRAADNAAKRKWRAINPEANREAGRKWREANPDYFREWQVAHPGYMAESSRRQREADPEGLNAYQRNWRRRLRDRVGAALAREQDWCCTWCQHQLPEDLTATEYDHIIPRAADGPDEDWNLQILHAECNRQKSDKITPQALALATEHGIVLAGAA